MGPSHPSQVVFNRPNSLPQTILPSVSTPTILIKFRRLCSARLDLRQLCGYCNEIMPDYVADFLFSAIFRALFDFAPYLPSLYGFL